MDTAAMFKDNQDQIMTPILPESMNGMGIASRFNNQAFAAAYPHLQTILNPAEPIIVDAGKSSPGTINSIQNSIGLSEKLSEAVPQMKEGDVKTAARHVFDGARELFGHLFGGMKQEEPQQITGLQGPQLQNRNLALNLNAAPRPPHSMF
jgi:hypothetical protein